MCSNKFNSLKAAYCAIRRANQRTGGSSYWAMDKDQQKEAVKRDKQLPLQFTQKVYGICDEVIGAMENVQYPGAADGDSMQERAGARIRTFKRKGGCEDVDEFMQEGPDGLYDYKLPRCVAENGMSWDEIKERRRKMHDEEYDVDVVDIIEEMRKRDDEHRRDTSSTWHCRMQQRAQRVRLRGLQQHSWSLRTQQLRRVRSS